MPTEARQAKIDHAEKHKITDVRVVLEDLHDPHNAGAILRTVEGLGAGSVWYLFDKEEPYDPKKIGQRSSATANKWVETRVFTDRSELEQALLGEGFESYATALHETKSVSLWEGDFKEGKMALWFGNERNGLSKEALLFCQKSIVIPMMGFIESFNISVAVGIILAEILRQRRGGE